MREGRGRGGGREERRGWSEAGRGLGVEEIPWAGWPLASLSWREASWHQACPGEHWGERGGREGGGRREREGGMKQSQCERRRLDTCVDADAKGSAVFEGKKSVCD